MLAIMMRDNGLCSAKVRTCPPIENMKVHHDHIHSACLLDTFTQDVQDLKNDALMGLVWRGIVPVCTVSGMPEPTTYGPKDPPLIHSGYFDYSHRLLLDETP